jgi:hypothetical protein
MTTTGKKTVLVASRHPHLEDVRKGVLEQAGYEVIAIRDPEHVAQACKNHQIDLALVGYSVTSAEKQRIADEAMRLCKCRFLNSGIVSRLKFAGKVPYSITSLLHPEIFWTR